MNGLVEFILNNVSLEDYYDKCIAPRDKRFQRYNFRSNKTVLCFFKDHEDLNPSMGYIYHKSNHNIKLCHCFGCGKTANVVRLHQILSSQYDGKELTEKEACYDLALIFNLELDEEAIALSEDDYEGRFNANMKRALRLADHYTVQDFRLALRDIRSAETVDLNKVNFECIKLIATNKQLYD